jgi:hypothetical protein
MPSTKASTAISKRSRNTFSPDNASSCSVMLNARPEIARIPTITPAAAPMSRMSSEIRPVSMTALARPSGVGRLPR